MTRCVRPPLKSLVQVRDPDNEAGISNGQGGTFVPAPVNVCYHNSTGNLSLDDAFLNNGSYGNPTDGDIGLATIPHSTGNCFSGDTDPRVSGLTSDPPGMESNPAYQPTNGECTSANTGDEGPLAAEALCASQLLAPCPTPHTLCQFNPSLPCVPTPGPDLPANYPRPTAFTLSMPPAQAPWRIPVRVFPQTRGVHLRLQRRIYRTWCWRSRREQSRWVAG